MSISVGSRHIFKVVALTTRNIGIIRRLIAKTIIAVIFCSRTTTSCIDIRILASILITFRTAIFVGIAWMTYFHMTTITEAPLVYLIFWGFINRHIIGRTIQIINVLCIVLQSCVWMVGWASRSCYRLSILRIIRGRLVAVTWVLYWSFRRTKVWGITDRRSWLLYNFFRVDNLSFSKHLSLGLITLIKVTIIGLLARFIIICCSRVILVLNSLPYSRITT